MANQIITKEDIKSKIMNIARENQSLPEEEIPGMGGEEMGIEDVQVNDQPIDQVTDGETGLYLLRQETI